jgi:hypothetical protein
VRQVRHAHLSHAGSLALKRAQIGEHVGGERVGVLHRVRAPDHSLGIDQIRVALGEVHLLRSGIARLVRDADLFVGVGPQRERKVELVAEGAVLFGCVEADPDDRRVERFELLGLITQTLALNRSAGCVGLGIPPQHDPTTA